MMNQFFSIRVCFLPIQLILTTIDTRSESPKVKDNTDPDILIDEVRTAIKFMKEGKS